jgi:uncharacterized protein (TIGR02145 family)
MRTQLTKITLAAIIAVAITFTLNACGSDDDGGGDNNSSDSGSVLSSSSGNASGSVKKDKISGFSQKGPFTRGSTITLYELDNDFAQTGRSFKDMIADDKGSFEIKNVELVSPYAMLEADGFYRNEVTGNISAAPIKLYAIADIREKSNVNVNILTHLEYYRIQKLIESGKNLAEAKKQAQGEILSVFGISGEFGNSEDMSIFGTGDGDAALLAISILLQGNLSEGKFTERLADFSLGFRETGVWDNETVKNAMADWAEKTNLISIKDNILDWNLSSSVPDFEKFASDYWYTYWYTNNGLGVCNADLQGSIKKSNRGVNYICKGKVWLVNYLKCFESNSCLTFTDTRDNQSYVYTVIGEQTWMAENLNYKASGSISNEYGSFYDWATVMALPNSCNTATCASQINESHRGICPEGWHLPTNAEWEKLVIHVGYASGATKLMATGGWLYVNNSTDEFGFAALPGAGYGNNGKRGDDVGTDALWHSASEGNAANDYLFGINGKEHIYPHAWTSYVLDDPYGKKIYLPVRCLQD